MNLESDGSGRGLAREEDTRSGRRFVPAAVNEEDAMNMRAVDGLPSAEGPLSPSASGVCSGQQE